MKAYLLSLIPFRNQFPFLTKREIEKKAGDYVLKKVLFDLFGITDIKINRSKKPFLENCPYHFNLSHSGDWLLLAVGDAPVGADIEKITTIRPKILEKYFNQAEQDRVKKNGAEEFFKIWTQKESYVKYTGEGIKGLSNGLDDSQEIAFFTQVYEGYQISVCTQQNHLPKEIEILLYQP